MTESSFAQVTRQGIEKVASEALAAGDSNLMNAQLDIWPTGHLRPDVSVEAAHHIASQQGRLARLAVQAVDRRAA